MCLGGGSAPSVKPVPAPPAVQPAPPPREAVAPRKPVEAPGSTPDVQLGTKKASKNRTSLTTSNAGAQSPNTGAKPGALNI
jgi:hypothetical protein